jgi:hypothetical protein
MFFAFFPFLGYVALDRLQSFSQGALHRASLLSKDKATRSGVKDHQHLFRVQVIWTFLWGDVGVRARIFLTHFHLELDGHVHEIHGAHFPLKKAHSSHSLPLENLHTPY